MTLTALPGASSCKGVEAHTTHLHQAPPVNEPVPHLNNGTDSQKPGRGLPFTWQHASQLARNLKSSAMHNRPKRQSPYPIGLVAKHDETKKAPVYDRRQTLQHRDLIDELSCRIANRKAVDVDSKIGVLFVQGHALLVQVSQAHTNTVLHNDTALMKAA